MEKDYKILQLPHLQLSDFDQMQIYNHPSFKELARIFRKELAVLVGEAMKKIKSMESNTKFTTLIHSSIMHTTTAQIAMMEAFSGKKKEIEEEFLEKKAILKQVYREKTEELVVNYQKGFLK